MAKSKQHYLIFTSGYGEELHFGGVHTVANRIGEILNYYGQVTVITEGKKEEVIMENGIEIRKWLSFEDMEKDFLSILKTKNINVIFFTDFRRAHFLLQYQNIIYALKTKKIQIIGDFASLCLEIDCLQGKTEYIPDSKHAHHHINSAFELEYIPQILQKNIFDFIHIPTFKSKEIMKKYFDIGRQKFNIEPWGICPNQIKKCSKKINKNIYYIAISLRKEKVKRFEIAEKLIKELNEKKIGKFILNVYGLDGKNNEIIHYKGALKNNEVLIELTKNDFILSTSYFDTFSISLIEGMSKSLIPIIPSYNKQQVSLLKEIAFIFKEKKNSLNLGSIINLIKKDPNLKYKEVVYKYFAKNYNLDNNLKFIFKI